MDNTITKQNQFPIFSRPVSAIPAGLPTGFFSQFLNTYPYLLNSSYFNPLNSNASSWLNTTNSSPNCPSPLSPSNNASSGRCPICYVPMQGIDANQHYIEELQKLENSRKKEAEEKCKSEIIDIEIENRNDENGILQALVRRGSRFTTRYQTYLKIKQNREQRKMRSYRKKLISDDKNYNSIQPSNLSSFTPHQLNQLNQFSFSAAAAAQNNLHNNLLLHHQHQTQLLANQANQQHANNQTSFINGLLNSIAAASCNSPTRSNNSNQTTCLDNVNETNLNLSNGLANTNNSNNGNGNTNSLGNSQSNDLSQDRISPGSTSSTPLTNLSSINGSANLLTNGTNLNNTTNGNTTPTSTNTNSPITTLSSLNGSNNIVATLQNTKQSPIWSIASITGLNAVANNQNSLLLNGLQSLNNELKRRCLSDEEDEDLEITDDRDSIASNK